MTNEATHYGPTDYPSRVTIRQCSARNGPDTGADRSVLLLS